MASIKIHLLRCGSVGVDSALPFNINTGLNPLAYTGFLRGKKHRVWLPCTTYLIEHPKGLILIDTGWDVAVRGDQRKYLAWLQYCINKALLPAGEAIHEQLAKLGYQPSDIDYLIFIHLHADHVSGINLVKDAKNILVSDLEMADTKKHSMHYLSFMWEGINFQQFSFSASEYGPAQRSFDLFEDGSFILINLPGHTAGQAGALITANGKSVLLCADGGYTKRNWEEMILPAVSISKNDSLATLK